MRYRFRKGDRVTYSGNATVWTVDKLYADRYHLVSAGGGHRDVKFGAARRLTLIARAVQEPVHPGDTVTTDGGQTLWTVDHVDGDTVNVRHAQGGTRSIRLGPAVHLQVIERADRPRATQTAMGGNPCPN